MKMVPLKLLASQIRGVTFSKGDAIRTAQTGYTAVIRGGNVGDGEILMNDLIYIPDDLISESQNIQAHDIVIVASSGSVASLGRAAFADHNFNACFGAFLKVLRPNPELIDPKYFFHYFQTDSYRTKISYLAQGANINNLNNCHLNELLIPVPSIEDQRRIAAILDQADALRAQRRAQLAHLDALPQAIFHEMFGPAGTHRKAGQMSTIGRSLELGSGEMLQKSKMIGGPYPVFGANGVSGFHNAYNSNQPTITIGRVGSCGAINITPSYSWITDNALVVRGSKENLPIAYLATALRAADLKNFASQSNQPLISQGRIADTPLFIPPEEALAKFEAINLAIRRQAKALALASSHMHLLRASLQSRAFRGEL